MYQARRVADVATVSVPFDGDAAEAAAFRSGPRRAVPSRASVVGARVAPLTLSAALLATAGALVLSPKGTAPADTVAVPDRATEVVSRDEARPLLEDAAAPAPATAAALVGQWNAAFGKVVDTEYVQQPTSVRATGAADAPSLGELAVGDKIEVTDRVSGEFQEVVYNKKVGYVLKSALADTPPEKEEDAKPAKATPAKATTTTTAKQAADPNISKAPTKSVLGLQPSAMVVYNAVMAKWNVPSVGGWRARSLSVHQYGLAIDFMVGREMGDQIADYLVANAGTFKVDHIIWRQRIWTPYKPYWRPMADRGSITANHYDHVHVAVTR